MGLAPNGRAALGHKRRSPARKLRRFRRSIHLNKRTLLAISGAGSSRYNWITLHDPPTIFQLSPACRPISRAVCFRRLG
jgi:hypothetical protein